jgi:hypothetical protein
MMLSLQLYGTLRDSGLPCQASIARNSRCSPKPAVDPGIASVNHDGQARICPAQIGRLAYSPDSAADSIIASVNH